MLVRSLNAFVQNVGLIALVLSMAVLFLLSNRDAFEVDTKPRTENDPIGGPRLAWQWKYLSDHAEDARSEILDLLRYLRTAAIILLILAVALFVFGGLVGVLDYFGFVELAKWWHTNPHVDLVFNHGFGIVLILFAPFMIYRLTRVVSNVVRARNEPDAKKPAEWTAYN